MTNDCTQANIRAKRRVLISQSTTVTGLDYALFTPTDPTNPLAGGELTLYFLNSNLPPLTLSQLQLVMLDGITPAPWSMTSIASVPGVNNALKITLQGSNQTNANVAQLYLVQITNASTVDLFFTQSGFVIGTGPVAADDCQTLTTTTGNNTADLTIDYLSKDYNSLRQLLLNRLSVTMPNWAQDSPADIGVMLVEILAYAADQLSYYQDAVATEAYLNTARRRISVRRHARLLNYLIHEGCNARTWVQFIFNGTDSNQNILQPGLQLLTQVTGMPAAITAADYAQTLESHPVIFETLTPVTLYASHNQIPFYTWGADDYSLPQGVTTATLDGDYSETLQVGDILLFTEVAGIQTGLPEDADPSHRCAVCLTSVTLLQDALFNNRPVTQITWASADALPFCLIVKSASLSEIISVACGNVALADHGQSINNNPNDPNFIDIFPNQVPTVGVYNPVLSQPNLTFAMPLPTVITSAQLLLQQDPHQALPEISLMASDPSNPTWIPQSDLFNSSIFAPNFVVEMENDRTAHLRFGDNTYGKQPLTGTIFAANYRVGNGTLGNIGANALYHWVVSNNLPSDQIILLSHVTAITNPLLATGGVDPESLTHIVMNAPQAFMQQPRYVTLQDYVTAALAYPGVAQAVANYEWTGSWKTLVVSVVRSNQQPVDLSFQQALGGFLNQQRLMGYDIQISDPIYVPLDIALVIQLLPGFEADQVYQSLRAHFNGQDSAGFRFFNPTQFSFGQSIYLSAIVAEVMTVPGVAGVDLSDTQNTRFQRYFGSALQTSALNTGVIQLAASELAQLDNDPNIPAHGQIHFIIEGVS